MSIWTLSWLTLSGEIRMHFGLEGTASDRGSLAYHINTAINDIYGIKITLKTYIDFNHKNYQNH